MTTAPTDRVRWSRRRWIYTILAVLAVHVLLILRLGQQPVAPTPVPAFGSSIELAADDWSERQLAQLPAGIDPTLFALPHPNSFSGKAWFTFEPEGHKISDWTESPRWLTLDTNRLGTGFSQWVDARKAAPLLVADSPMPPLAGIDLLLPPQPMRSKSNFHLEGDLTRRKLLEPFNLPSLPSLELLTNSVVQLIVDANGFTLSALLLSNTAQKDGPQKDADQLALRTASDARFEPLPPVASPSAKAATVSIGTIVFEWHTVEPKVTNTASLAP